MGGIRERKGKGKKKKKKGKGKEKKLKRGCRLKTVYSAAVLLHDREKNYTTQKNDYKKKSLMNIRNYKSSGV